MDLYRNKYRISSTRLANWDYGSNGFYFVTICTKAKERYFGDIPDVETQYFASAIDKASAASVADKTQNIESLHAASGADKTQNIASLHAASGADKTQNIASLHAASGADKTQNIGSLHAASGADKTQNIASLHATSDADKTQNIATDKTQNIASLHATEIGEIAIKYWTEIPLHFSFVELDEFVVMPDHIHGILLFNKPDYSDWKPNKVGPQSQNLASVMRGYKAGVKAYATTNGLEFQWQSRFYDRVIKSADELERIRKYIIDNPAKWSAEKNNPENLYR
jgi:putative transposase